MLARDSSKRLKLIKMVSRKFMRLTTILEYSRTLKGRSTISGQRRHALLHLTLPKRRD